VPTNTPAVRRARARFIIPPGCDSAAGDCATPVVQE
jgi:hypothetical protein